MCVTIPAAVRSTLLTTYGYGIFKNRKLMKAGQPIKPSTTRLFNQLQPPAHWGITGCLQSRQDTGSLSSGD